MDNNQEVNITDKRTLGKMLECLNNAKTSIGSIEMKATMNNINAVSDAISMIQIVGNTIIAELQKPDKEEKTDGTKPDVQ